MAKKFVQYQTMEASMNRDLISWVCIDNVNIKWEMLEGQ
jgi:hypothetical protein